MKEKKEFFIPKNVSDKFELIPGVPVKDLKVIIPGALLDIPLFMSDITIYAKIPVGVVAVALPLFFVIHRPYRENITFLEHVKEMVKFTSKQKEFYYRKERMDVYESFTSEHEELEGRETTRISTATNPNTNVF